MAKKRKYKKRKKNKGYIKEIVGIVFITISLLGLFTDQNFGNFISGIAIYLFGNIYFLLLAFLFLAGLYLIVQRKMPEIFKFKYIGIYILLISTLTFLHMQYLNYDSETIFSVASDHLHKAISLEKIAYEDISSGGIIGASLLYFMKEFFGTIGVRIFISALTAIGVILTFNLSLRDIILKIYKAIVRSLYFIKDAFVEIEEEEVKEEKPVVEELKENKKVVANLDELIKINDTTKEPDKTEIKKTEKKVVSGYELPPMTLLDEIKKNKAKENTEDVKNNVSTLEKVLKDFDIEAKVVEIHIGPTVTQYEMELKAGTKVNKVLGIHREIALALAAKDIRIQAPIPSKSTIGIEIPNKITSFVSLREMLEAIPEHDDRKLLTVLGKNIMGRPIQAEISSMPHLLVAGATGSGKSVCINGIIISILMRNTPEDVKFVLIDPKKVELQEYEGIPHLMAPVVTNPKKAAGVLQKILGEMENRYELFNETKTKNFKTYNEYIKKKNRGIPTAEQEKKLPYIIVIIDELADLMMVAQKEVENSIMRITQMARAAGIHLIVATQRPSTDVVTGTIKANIPSRIAFAVSSSIDSRTILDSKGAEKLIGNGDMLFMPINENAAQRIQGAYVADEEIKRVVEFVSNQREAEYDENLTQVEAPENSISSEPSEVDELYSDVVEFIVKNGKASTSLIQRTFSIGFNRAAKIMDQLEENNIVGPQKGSKPRDVLIEFKE